jgi:ABC-type sugar transport system substrate-binding protein/nitrogen-specific signal transduction histidine kinase
MISLNKSRIKKGLFKPRGFFLKKKFFIVFLLLVIILPLFLLTCNSIYKSKNEIRIGFSQCTSDDEWRQLMNQEIERECKLIADYNVELITKDAQNNSNKQIEDIKELIDKKVDIIIVSPKEAKPLTPILERAYNLGIPVIVVDRKIDSENFTAFVGGDNLLIGKEAGYYAAKLIQGKGNILEITGLEGSTPAMERSKGFHDALEMYDSIKITHIAEGQWYHNIAEKACDSIFTIDKKIDLVFCHNDFMALGAYNACVTNNFFPKIIGIDGLATPNGGINMVIDGKIEATFLYPSGGEKAVQLAMNIVLGKAFDKYNTLYSVRIDKSNAQAMLLQDSQIKEQFQKIDQQQLLIGRMSKLLHKQSLFLYLSIVIILLIVIVVILVLVLLKNKTKTNALLMESNQLIASQNDKIKAQRDHLEELNATKDKLFTIIAHDLINPFNVIIGYADLLKNTSKISSPDEIEDQANTILQASEDAHILLNNLLQWARTQQNVIKFSVAPVLISQILENELRILNKHAEKKSVQILVHIENTEKEAAADKNLIGIVIRNLITNAVKYSNPGSIIAININYEQEKLVFSIKDEGVGMSQSKVDELFKVKPKSSTPGTKGEKGTGLGLLLCKDFIEKHHGELWVESQVGKGSTFYFSLSYC